MRNTSGTAVRRPVNGGEDGNGIATAPESDELQRRKLAELADVYRGAYAGLVRNARRMVGSTEAAEDAVQEALARTIAAVRRGVEIDDMAAWLFTVVRNVAVIQVRRRTTTPLSEAGEPADASRGSPADEIQTRDRFKEIFGAIAGLPRSQRLALLMASVQGQSYEEIARELDRSEISVHGLLQRARQGIRKVVGPVGLPAVVALLRRRPPEQTEGKVEARATFTALVSQPLQSMIAAGATAVIVGTLAVAGGTRNETGDRPQEDGRATPAVSRHDTAPARLGAARRGRAHDGHQRSRLPSSRGGLDRPEEAGASNDLGDPNPAAPRTKSKTASGSGSRGRSRRVASGGSQGAPARSPGAGTPSPAAGTPSQGANGAPVPGAGQSQPRRSQDSPGDDTQPPSEDCPPGGNDQAADGDVPSGPGLCSPPPQS